MSMYIIKMLKGMDARSDMKEQTKETTSNSMNIASTIYPLLTVKL